MRIVALLVMLTLAIGAIVAPDLLLQVFFRGGFLIGGIAIALALRPSEDAGGRAPLPVAATVRR